MHLLVLLSELFINAQARITLNIHKYICMYAHTFYPYFLNIVITIIIRCPETIFLYQYSVCK